MDGNRFSIEFEPELTSTDSVASQLCNDNVELLNLNESSLPGCISPISQYLLTSVKNWVDDKALRTSLTVDGVQTEILFYPEVDTASDVAVSYCQRNAETLALTSENITNCINPVERYLQGAVVSWINEKTLETVLTINGYSFDVNFIPSRQTSASFANQLCVRNSELLSVTDQNLLECISPVNDYLNKAIAQWIESKTLTVQVTVNKEPLTITYMPERTSSLSVARTFCNRASVALGNEEDDLVNNCVLPISKYLTQSVNEWINDKLLAVTLEVNAKKETFQFLPERQSTLTLARKFCVGKAKEYSLTNDNIVAECVLPLSDMLQIEVNKWAMAKRQATAAATAIPDEVATA